MLATSCGSPRAADTDLTPIVDGLLSTWAERGADLLCLGEDHGSPTDAALREALVTDRRFPETVRRIIVEWASPVHQAQLDRFVTGGEAMDRETLAPIWQDAGRGVAWQLPIYERFLRTVREVNLDRPADHRVRIVGGATPIPWPSIDTAETLLPWLDRQHHLHTLLLENALGAAGKTLAIFGAFHCEKKGPGAVARLHRELPGRIWSAFAFTGTRGDHEGRLRLDLGPQPAWIRITGTPHATLPVGRAFFEGHAYDDTTFGDLLDAVVVYGSLAQVPRRFDERALGVRFHRELARRDRLRRNAAMLVSRQVQREAPD